MSTQDHSIDRREALRRVGLMFGGAAFVGGSRLLDAFEGDVHGRAEQLAQAGRGVGEFTAADIAFLDEVADTILPTTSTPGAKAARTGAFMAVMVNDTYGPSDQNVFRKGMRTLDDAAQKSSGATFMKSTPRQRLALLERLDREAKTYMDAVQAARDKAKRASPSDGVVAAGQPLRNPDIGPDAPTHYFRMMKELTMLGYFTSQIGCTQAQRYIESPGRFDPCAPYQKGERSWASHA
ncbi:MAG TPA: gluconate 2-dehydrogenase subunit 3 family protein [Gemmatimonadaceae bacterium]|jgi:hypothetical protein|nr:gluconate 2-dehydrogenase subunit 3 family protein [Gemmatimonadaceae bacterium]